MKIDKENMQHVQEILEKHGVDGLNDLDQRLFEWGEENMRTFEVTIPKTVAFRIRVNAINAHNAIAVAENILEITKEGPNVEHGSYYIAGPAGEDSVIPRAVEVRDA